MKPAYETLLRNYIFMPNEIFQWNALKFALQFWEFGDFIRFCIPLSENYCVKEFCHRDKCEVD